MENQTEEFDVSIEDIVPGDIVDIEIEGIGILRNPVVGLG